MDPNHVCPIATVDEDARLTTFPILHKGIFEFYKEAESLHWGVNEVNLSRDAIDWVKLSPEQKHCVKFIIAFFASSDKIVNINIVSRFKKDFPILEVEYFYDTQVAMENIHAHMYALLADTIIPDATERKRLLNAIKTIPVITKMSDYMFRCINSNERPASRILRMACVEGIFFTGCFCIIYWLTSHGLMPGLGQSNELIARDEALHTTFPLFLYELFQPEYKLEPAEIYKIFSEAVDIAIEFVRAAVPPGMAEMSPELMIPYVQCCADNLLALIGVAPLYKATHDFHFMEQINYKNRGNFFERKVSEYSKVSVSDQTAHEVATDF
jgi:ribonucleoside-diphosphate reductase subunit M2